MFALAAIRTRRDGGNDVNDPQETCAGQDFRDAKMNQCGQRLRDRSPRGRSQPERVRRIGAPMNVSEKDTRDIARIWTDRRIPAACRGAVFHDQIVESSWSRSPRLSRVKSIFPCRPCMAIAWADISAVMSPRQYLGMAVRSEETSTIQPDVVRHQRGAQSRPFSEPRDRTASGETNRRSASPCQGKSPDNPTLLILHRVGIAGMIPARERKSAPPPIVVVVGRRRAFLFAPAFEIDS